jgi:choline dehydrogenase-like flavoprotein
LQVGDQRFPRPISRAFVQAMGDVQVPENPDFNGEVQEGAGLYQVTQFHSGPRKGERCSAAAAYLHPALTRSNLTVLTRTRVEKITFEGKRATGVIIKRGLTRRTLTARAEAPSARPSF